MDKCFGQTDTRRTDRERNEGQRVGQRVRQRVREGSRLVFFGLGLGRTNKERRGVLVVRQLWVGVVRWVHGETGLREDGRTEDGGSARRSLASSNSINHRYNPCSWWKIRCYRAAVPGCSPLYGCRRAVPGGVQCWRCPAAYARWAGSFASSAYASTVSLGLPLTPRSTSMLYLTLEPSSFSTVSSRRAAKTSLRFW
eukprot:scaffold1637_cov253-Pinguiococcus_pyrenoidosus.AAC.7